MDALRGTLTALVTPFRNDEIDIAALERLVQRQLDAGVEGLVPCGTTGEAPTLSLAEHRQIVSVVSKMARKKALVVAGAGSNSTREAIELARLNADCGADALLLVTPYYNKPSQEGLFRHFSAIAQATPLPIVLYNIPGRTAVELSVDTIKRLFDAHPNIVAMKHATGGIMDASDLRAACNIRILSGDDPLTLALMSIGAVGVVSTVSNLVPRAVKRLTDAALAGDLTAARAAHDALYSLARAVLSVATNPMPVKTALALRGLCRDEFRLPLCPLSDDKKQILEKLLHGLELE